MSDQRETLGAGKEEISDPCGASRASINHAVLLTQTNDVSLPAAPAGDARSTKHSVFSALHAPVHTNAFFPRGKPQRGQTKGFFRFQVCTVSTTATNRVGATPNLSPPKSHCCGGTAAASTIASPFSLQTASSAASQPATSNTGFS